jgi:hypothetical protein
MRGDRVRGLLFALAIASALLLAAGLVPPATAAVPLHSVLQTPSDAPVPGPSSAPVLRNGPTGTRPLLSNGPTGTRPLLPEIDQPAPSKTDALKEPGAQLGFSEQSAATYTLSGHVELFNAFGPDIALQPGDVEVELWSGTGDQRYPGSWVTDASGNYVVTDVASGSYLLVFHYLGTLGGVLDTIWGLTPYTGTAINVQGSQTGLNKVIGAGRTLAGTVTDSGGAPVADVNVYSSLLEYASENVWFTYEAQTDAQGHFQFRGAAWGARWVVQFEKGGYASQSWPGWSYYYYPGILDLSTKYALPFDIDATLFREATISGSVSAATTDPGLTDGSLSAHVMSYDYQLQTYVDTGDRRPVGSDGTYTVDGLAPGDYRIALVDSRAGGYPTAISEVITVAEDAHVQNFWMAAGGSQTTTFVDVGPSHPFSKPIQWMFDQGISTGYIETNGQRTFRPSDAVTRQAMAAFLYRAAGSPAFVAPVDPSFVDVPVSSAFYNQIEWMKAEGISTGYPQQDGSVLFNPSDGVSRQAMSAFLYRAASSPAFTPPTTPSFSDVPYGVPFYSEIEWMKAQGISTGYSAGAGFEFHPASVVTRQAMAAFLYRAYRAVRPDGWRPA